MNRYICLLRSVNVSGVNLIKMSALKAFFEEQGFCNVLTYIQSGNVLFDAGEIPDSALMEKALEARFGTRNVAVILKTSGELEAVIRQNPFTVHPSFQPKNLYVHFLQNPPEEEQAEKIRNVSFEGEYFARIADVVYVYYETPSRRNQLSNAFFESRLRVRATARNWNTTLKLQSLAAPHDAFQPKNSCSG